MLGSVLSASGQSPAQTVTVYGTANMEHAGIGGKLIIATTGIVNSVAATYGSSLEITGAGKAYGMGVVVANTVAIGDATVTNAGPCWIHWDEHGTPAPDGPTYGPGSLCSNTVDGTLYVMSANPSIGWYLLT